jgi:predicted transcriptional regulator
MSFSYSQDVTLISLIFSVAALVIGLVLIGVILSLRNNFKKDMGIDASALVREFSERQRRLEQKLIDQKVSLEILELRLSRGEKSSPIVGDTLRVKHETEVEQGEGGSVVTRPLPYQRFGNDARETRSSSGAKRDKTILEILEVVSSAGGKITARQIQERIGRSREHTARMMNFLYKEGLVSRDVSERPFTYMLTDAGRRELGG